jgi:hypothetical protein
MEKLVFSASNGKHVPSGGGHYFARGGQGWLIEAHPDFTSSKTTIASPTDGHRALSSDTSGWVGTPT